jgi:hypothetical protein
MPDARTRDKSGPIDWLALQLAELWARIKEHPDDCRCWDCRHWRTWSAS